MLPEPACLRPSLLADITDRTATLRQLTAVQSVLQLNCSTRLRRYGLRHAFRPSQSLSKPKLPLFTSTNLVGLPGIEPGAYAPKAYRRPSTYSPNDVGVPGFESPRTPHQAMNLVNLLWINWKLQCYQTPRAFADKVSFKIILTARLPTLARSQSAAPQLHKVVAAQAVQHL